MRTRGAALPANWAPSKDDILYGVNLGFQEWQIAGMAEDMRLWAEANANRPIAKKARWGAAFKGWMRREAGRRGMNGNGPATESSRMSYMDIAQGLRNDDGAGTPDFFSDARAQPRGSRHH